MLRRFNRGGDVAATIGDLLFSDEGNDVSPGPFFCDVDAAREMAQLTGFELIIKRVKYIPEARARGGGGDREVCLRILSVEDVPALQRARRAAEKDPTIKAALRCAAKPRVPRKASRTTKSVKAKVDKTGQDHVKHNKGPAKEDDPKDTHEPAEKDDSPEATSTDASGDESSESNEDGLLDSEERSLWREASTASSAEKPEAAPEPVPPPPPPPPPADEPVRKADGSVVLGDKKLGRVTYNFRNPLKPSMFLYCRKHHQCYKSASGRKNPTEAGAIRWLAWGHSDACDGKAAHQAAFEQMVCGGPA